MRFLLLAWWLCCGWVPTGWGNATGFGDSGWKKSKGYAISEAQYLAFKDLETECAIRKQIVKSGSVQYRDPTCQSQDFDKETYYSCNTNSYGYCVNKPDDD